MRKRKKKLILFYRFKNVFWSKICIFAVIKTIKKGVKMSKVAGITVEKSARGIPRYVRIDLKKFPEFIPILREKGVMDKVPNRETLKALKEAESKKLKKYDSVSELISDLQNEL